MCDLLQVSKVHCIDCTALGVLFTVQNTPVPMWPVTVFIATNITVAPLTLPVPIKDKKGTQSKSFQSKHMLDGLHLLLHV